MPSGLELTAEIERDSGRPGIWVQGVMDGQYDLQGAKDWQPEGKRSIA
jgi:hypothetical protein